MSYRAAACIAWSFAALSLVMFAASVALHLATLPVQPPPAWGTGGISVVLYVYLPFLAFPLVGALIASKRPTNPIGWICLAVGLLWMLSVTSGPYAVYGLRVATYGSVPFPTAISSLGESTGPTALALLGTYLILLFPNGRLPSRRWRPLAWFSGAVIVLNFVVGILAPVPLSDLRNVSNPFGLEGHPWVADARDAVGLLLPLCLLASAVSLVLRYRSSGGEVREQIKWIAFAASVVAVGVSAAVISGTLFASDAIGSTGLSRGNLLEDMVTLSFAGVPIAVGFAVLKYRLYDIEVVINRALIYGSLTATLVLVYVGGIVLLQRLFVALTGEKSTLAVVVSTLVIAALFNPLRRRIQGFIDRRFYRRKYDARKTLEAFSARLRDETDLDALSNDLVEVARETMQPAHVALWLRSSDGIGLRGKMRLPSQRSLDDGLP